VVPNLGNRPVPNGEILHFALVSLCRQPPHSHSIVSGKYKLGKLLAFSPAYNKLTVRFTVKKIQLSAIDGDRCRKLSCFGNCAAQRGLACYQPGGSSQSYFGGLDGNTDPYRSLAHAIIETEQSEADDRGT